MSIPVKIGESAPLVLVLPDGDATKYPRAYVYDAAGGAAPLATVDLAHVVEGYYFGTWTVPSANKFVIRYKTFSDAGRTTESVLHGQVDELLVGDLSSIVGGGIAEAQLNIAFDDTGMIFRAAAWMDRDGQTVTTPTGCTITVHRQDHTVIFTDTTASHTNGVFIFEQASVVLADNKVGYVRVEVTDGTGTARTVQSFSTVA
jgi:hypothetical protein